jgi:inner membrane protein
MMARGAGAPCRLHIAFDVQGHRRRTSFLGPALYALVYVLMQMEQRALLPGSLLLFAVLTGLMVATRRVDGYALLARMRGESGPRST